VRDESLAPQPGQAPHVRRLRLADAEWSLASSDAALLDLLVGLLRAERIEEEAPRPAGDERPACRVEALARLPDWRERYCGRAPRIVDQPEIGRVALHPHEGGTAIVCEGLGLVLAGAAGPEACLIEPSPAELAADRRPNLSRLAIILRGELLLCAGRLGIHAGAVGRGGACEIWTGPSGAGKTTQVLRLAAEGWDFYGDDHIILGRDDRGGFRLWPDWRPPRVTAETCRAVPQLTFLEGRPEAEDGKQDFGFEKVFGVHPPDPGHVERIHFLLPDRTPVDRPLSPAEAFHLAAPGLMHFAWPGHAGWVAELVLDLVSSVPVRLVSWGAL
jgi:hypothetical protein